jgi:acetoacetyl-CoA reductase
MTGRVALATGGTRGIGRTISISLKAVGYQVVANYSGNDDAAAAFTKETVIPNYKFDVSDFDGCQKNAAKIAEERGPVEVLVNNAGTARDGTLHEMAQE